MKQLNIRDKRTISGKIANACKYINMRNALKCKVIKND